MKACFKVNKVSLLQTVCSLQEEGKTVGAIE